jgi:hypothetical protein
MKHVGILVAIASVASGCQAVPRAPDYTGATAVPVYDMQSATVAAPTASATSQQQPVYAVSPIATSNPQLEATVLNLRERLERVEKAMLRLDRRMQLVERNELSRMSSGQTSDASDTIMPTASEEQTAMRALNLGPSQGEFRAVSAQEGSITSALQAAPRATTTSAFSSLADESSPRRDVAGLPSLADPAPLYRSAPTAPAAQMAIWTVSYNPDKIWPDRNQLSGSQDVVEALRKSGGMTLYARGKNANGVQFRERVKALSRYLSKVSGLETVPIVAMAAPRLDDETIEILATR